MRKGFTLIEMSIVLVIIGLLVAGIIIAQSLIRTSQVQSIIKDVATYQGAISQFKQKYGMPPGDLTNATTYWGTNPNCATGGTGTGTQTCNGNGDGQITYNNSGTGPYEQFLVWQHLANGGFITGQYSGAEYPGVPSNAYMFCSPGANCPGGKVNVLQAYLIAYSTGRFANSGLSGLWTLPPGHYLLVGQTNPFGVGVPGWPGNAMLTVPEAYALDLKVDDGLPGLGLWRSLTANSGGQNYENNCAVNGTTGLAVTDGTIASQATAVYNTSYSKTLAACSFLIQLNF